MNRLEQLRKQLEEKKAEGRAIIEAAEAEDRDLTDAESDALDEIETEVATLDDKVKEAASLAERRRNFEPVRSAHGQNTVRDPNPATTGGFKDLGEFAVAVHGAVQAGRLGGSVDPRLRQMAVANTHQGGAASGEGYELPTEFRDVVWEIVSDFDEFGPLIDEEPTSARKVHLGADETTPWGNSGIQAYWRGEGQQMAASKLATEGRDVPVHDLYTLALATEELLEDAPRLTNRLTRKAAQAIAWKKNQAIVEGNGVGKPLGWTKSSAQVTVAKETGQGADTIVAANVAKMYSRLQRVPGDSPFWMINQDALPQLMVMTIQDRPIWTPPNGFIEAPGGLLLGLPIRFSEFAETVGDKNDIQLISPRGYYGARRSSGPNFASSIHLYFDYAIEAFRWTFRYGGQPYLSAPISPNKGASTRSHFVTLAARA